MVTTIKIGQPVFYNPYPGHLENGLIKSLCEDPNYVFVVYNCNDEWDRFKDYTGCRTHINDLFDGWVDKDGRTPLHQELVKLKEFGLMDELP